MLNSKRLSFYFSIFSSQIQVERGNFPSHSFIRSYDMSAHSCLTRSQLFFLFHTEILLKRVQPNKNHMIHQYKRKTVRNCKNVNRKIPREVKFLHTHATFTHCSHVILCNLSSTETVVVVHMRNNRHRRRRRHRINRRRNNQMASA